MRRSVPVLVLLIWLALPAPQVPADPLVLCNWRVATIIGTEGDDDLRGTSHDDVIVGLGGRDTIRGLAGDDTICGGDASDTIYPGAGNTGCGTVGLDCNGQRVYGESGDDRLVGHGSGVAWGGPGNDRIVDFSRAQGGPGDDHMQGPNSIWSLDFSGGKGNDVLVGSGESDEEYFERLYGGPGNDLLRGNGGLQYLEPGPGRDTVLGGPRSGWSSFLSYRESPSGVVINLTRGTVRGGEGIDRVRGVSFILGSAHDDTMIGSHKRDVLEGCGGADRLWGRKGNDDLEGDGPGPPPEDEEGVDYYWCLGEAGHDVADGGRGYDDCEADVVRRCEISW